jgi:ketosteroid isomerase-like protein
MRGTTVIGTLALLLAAAVAGAPLRGGMIGMAGSAAPDLTRVADAFAAAMRAGDAKAAAAVFADDGTDMPPGSGPVRGHAAIEAYYRGLFGACRFAAFDLTETESRISGEVGYIAGVARVAVAGRPAESGKYLVVLKRSAEGWKVAYAIHNDDAPPPGPPPGR